jgi:hypothetical protein
VSRILVQYKATTNQVAESCTSRSLPQLQSRRDAGMAAWA